MRYLSLAFFALLALAVPSLAVAQGLVSPVGGNNAWDLFVFGNGRVIYDVLIAIKMFMMPDAGETGFRSLLLLVATIGFVLLAIQAGFDPGRNLLKMFTYIFVAWGVFFASTQLTANITVNDRVTGYYNTVTGVPFVVGVPAALVSQIGDYFTRSIETYFQYPNELKMAGASVGQFNLFGRMMEESTQYTITEPSLRDSLRAYVADCTVPAIARGALTGTKTVDNQQVQLFGTDAILNSDNLLEVLKSAQHNSVLTKYFPMPSAGNVIDRTRQTQRVQQAMAASPDVKDSYFSGQGLLISCDAAYNAIEQDMMDSAQKMMDASSAQWSKTGVQVTLESVHSAVIGAVAQGGSNQFARFSSPNSFVQQQSMINLMGGAFRQAAAQTGNNEALTASLVSMAEQQQKSSWGTAFGVFNNMMGYVYTVLQAFIFAISPLIIVAMLIPGMGGGIVTNYSQILVWLMLWQPMLAIINFLITLFGAEQVSQAWSSSGGPTVGNRAITSEKTNDLMLAAQFLGTMTPLISWGIVKGAMAFTEFIQKGVGSDVAAQAGANAAAGNMSMGTTSMNNTSMNSFSTAGAASVGFKSTTGYFGAGAIDSMQSAGGTTAQANSGNINPSSKLTEQLSQQEQMAKSTSNAISAMQEHGLSKEEAFRQNFSKGDQAGQQHFNNTLDKAGFSYSESQKASLDSKSGTSAGTGSSVQNSESNSDSLAVSAKAGVSAKGGFEAFGTGMGASAGVDATGQKQDVDSTQRSRDASQKTDTSEGASIGRDASSGRSSGHEASSGTQNTSGSSFGRDSSASMGYSESQRQALSNAYQANEQWSQSISSSLSAERSMGYNHSTDLAYGQNEINNIEFQRQQMYEALESARGSDMRANAGSALSGASALSGPGIGFGDVGNMGSSLIGEVNSGMSGSLGSVNPNSSRGAYESLAGEAGGRNSANSQTVQAGSRAEYSNNAKNDQIASQDTVTQRLIDKVSK